MSDESLFRSGLLIVKELLLRPWKWGAVEERIEPPCGDESVDHSDESSQVPQASQITWLGGGTVLIQLGQRRVLVDPIAVPRPWWNRSRHKAAAWKNIDPIDVIVMTHRGAMNPRLLQVASRKTPVVVPTGLGANVCRRGFDQVVELAAGEQFADGDLDVTALRTTLVTGRQRLWSLGGNIATWGGIAVQVAGTSPQEAVRPTVWFLRHSGKNLTDLDRRPEFGPSPDVILVPLNGQRALWPTRRQGMMPEIAIETFRSVGGRVFIPLGVDSTQDVTVADPLAARLRSLWEAHKPPGATLLIPQIGERVEVPGRS